MYINQTVVEFANALMGKVLGCGDLFSEQHNKPILVEMLPQSVRDNMRVYCAVRSTMQDLQLAQYAGTIMQLGVRTPLSSTKIRPGPLRRCYARNQPKESAGGCSRVSRKESIAAVALFETPSNGEVWAKANAYREITHKYLSSATSNSCYCHVFLGCDHPTEGFLFSVDADKLVVIRKANWKFLFFQTKKSKVALLGEQTTCRKILQQRMETITRNR